MGKQEERAIMRGTNWRLFGSQTVSYLAFIGKNVASSFEGLDIALKSHLGIDSRASDVAFHCRLSFR